MELVDLEELRRIKTRFDSCRRIVDSIFEIAKAVDGQSVYAKSVAQVLFSLNEKLVAAAKDGKETCSVLSLSGFQGDFRLKSGATDEEKLGNSPVLVKFLQILEAEGLKPFIKTISLDEALRSALSGGSYIFVRLPQPRKNRS
ncbi:MAG TPA: hypothetical protein VJB70_03150 [Candidatus Paceibacterota bacterium]